MTDVDRELKRLAEAARDCEFRDSETITAFRQAASPDVILDLLARLGKREAEEAGSSAGRTLQKIAEALGKPDSQSLVQDVQAVVTRLENMAPGGPFPTSSCGG